MAVSVAVWLCVLLCLLLNSLPLCCCAVSQTEHAAAVAKHRNKWSFKSLQKMCESLLRLERFEEVEGTYSKLLGLMNESYVTANDRDQASCQTKFCCAELWGNCFCITKMVACSRDVLCAREADCVLVWIVKCTGTGRSADAFGQVRKL